MKIGHIFAATLIAFLSWTLISCGYYLYCNGAKFAIHHFEEFSLFPFNVFRYGTYHSLRCIGLAIVGFIVVFGLFMLTSHEGGSSKPNIATSRFATLWDFWRAKLFSNKGLFLGQRFGKMLHLPGFESMLLVAPTGSGKTECLAIPNILEFEGSIIANDLKGELFDLCSRPLYDKKGYHCYSFAPMETSSCGYNPFAFVRETRNERINDLILLSSAIIPGGKTEASDFWQNKSQVLFVSLSIYLLETSENPTLGALFDLAHACDIRGWANEVVSDGTINEPLFQQFLQDIIDGEERTVSNILSSFRAAIQVFGIPSVRNATNSNDLPIDRLRAQKLFLCFQFPADETHKILPLITALWVQIINIQTRHNKPKGLPLLCLLDEFGNLGKIDGLAKGMTYLRSYKIRLMVIVQHLGQIVEKYGQNTTRSFLSAKAKVFYGLTDLTDAKFVSELLGKTEKPVKNKSVQTTPGKGSSISITNSWQQRELMTPDEVMRLKRNKGLIILEGNYPMQINKKPWSKFKKFKLLLRGDK